MLQLSTLLSRRTGLVSLLLAGGLLATLAGCANAPGHTRADASASNAPRRVVMGVRKPKHLKVAMKTAGTMLAGNGRYRAEKVAVVACGPAVREMQTGSPVADALATARDRGIALKACGVTVDKMGLDRDAFLDGIEVVPNGLTEIVRLQSQGYHSIEL